MRHGLTDGEREVMAEIERDCYESAVEVRCDRCGEECMGYPQEENLCDSCCPPPDLWPPLPKPTIGAQEQGRRAA